MTLAEHYAQATQSQHFKSDEAQLCVIHDLECLAQQILSKKKRSKLWHRKHLQDSAHAKGVYIYSGVGRGKSFVMDCFYDYMPIEEKCRVHFYQFMKDVYYYLKQYESRNDPLKCVAKLIAKKYKLVCFDEFHISDVTEATIFKRLMPMLFNQQVRFCMTSNYHPDDLFQYASTHERAMLMPLINVLKTQLKIVHMDAGQDYRQQKMSHQDLFYQTDDVLKQQYIEYAGGDDYAHTVTLSSREFHGTCIGKDVAWFDFYDICGEPVSKTELLELAERFQTLIISDVPLLSTEMTHYAKRFIWFIEIVYQTKNRLIFSSQHPLSDIYPDGLYKNEFKKATSRIAEMQSDAYIQQEVVQIGNGFLKS